MADLSITTEIVGLNAITSGMAGITKSVETMRQSAERAAQSLSDFGQSMSLKVTAPLTLIGKASIDAEAQMNKLNVIFKTATGSAASAGKELDFVRKVAGDLGIPFAEAAEQFGRLLISSDSMAKNLPVARGVFVGFSEALRATGATSSQIALAFNALSQMSSKGRVSLEELSQQLGDHLPGALKFAAEGMGKTTGELLKMIQNGEVTADVLLPRMASALHKTFGEGAKEASELWPAVFARFRNAIFGLNVVIGESGLSDFMISITKAATDAINWLTQLDEPTRRFIVTVGGIAAAAGPAALVLGQALKVLLVMASPFALAATAAAALVTAFNGWDEVGRVVADVGRSIADFSVAAGGHLEQALTEFRGFAGEVKAAFDAGGVSAALDVILAGLTSLASSARDKLSTLGSDIYEAVRGQLETIGPRIGPAAEAIGKWIAEAIPRGVSALTDLGGRLLASIGVEVDNLQGSLLALGGKVGEWLIAGVPALLLGKGLGTLTTRLLAWIEAEVRALEPMIARATGEAGRWIVESIPDGFKSASTFVPTLVQFIADGVEAARGGISSAMSAVGEWIAAAIPDSLKDRATAASTAISSWFSGLTVSTESVAAVGRSIADALQSAISFAASTISSAVGPISRAIIDAVNSAIDLFEPQSFSLGMKFGEYIADLFGGQQSQTRIFEAITKLVSSVVKFSAGAFVPAVTALAAALVDWWSRAADEFATSIRGSGAGIAAKIADYLTAETSDPAFKSRMDQVLKAIADTFMALSGLIVAALVGLGKALAIAIGRELDELAPAVRAWFITFTDETIQNWETWKKDSIASIVTMKDDLIKSTRETFSEWGDQALSYIDEQFRALKTKIEKAIDENVIPPFRTIIEKIKAAWSTVKAEIDRLINDYIIEPFRAIESKLRAVLPTSMADTIFGPQVVAEIKANAEAAVTAATKPFEEVKVILPDMMAAAKDALQGQVDQTVDLYGTGMDAMVDSTQKMADEIALHSIVPEMGAAVVASIKDTTDKATVDWEEFSRNLPALTSSGLGKTVDEFKNFSKTLEGIVNSPILGLEQKITQLERLQDRAATAGKNGVAAIDNIRRELADLYSDAAKNDIKTIVDGTTASWQDQIEALVVASQRYQDAGETGQKAVKSIADEVEKLLDLNLANFGTELGGAWSDQIAEIDRTRAAIVNLGDAGKEAGQQLVELRERVVTAWANTEITRVMDSVTMTIDEQKAAIAQLGEFYSRFGQDGAAAMQAVREAQENLARQTPTLLEGMKQGWVSYYNEVTNLGKSAADATAQGLRTVESTLSEFFKTGKLNFTSLKEFAIQTYADMAAQATMSMVVQSGNAFKEWLFGAQTSAAGVQTAVEGSMTGAAAATTGFGTQAQGVFSGLWEFVTAGFGGMMTSITGILGGLLTFFTDLLTQIGGLFSSLWTSIVEGASSLMGSLGELLGGLGSTVGGVVDTVGGLFGGLWDTITTAGSGAMDLIGGAVDLFGGNSASVMDTVSTGWSTLFGGMGTTATDTLGVVNAGVDLAGVTFGEVMGGMTIASDATFDGLGTVADYTFGSMGGAAIDMGTVASGAMANTAASGASSFLGLSQSAISSISTIGTVISAVGVGASMFFDGLSSQTSGAINAIAGVGTALASLAAGNPLGVIAGAVAALQGAAAVFGGSTHDNYSVNIGRDGKISTGTNTNPNPQYASTANSVAKQVSDFLVSRGINERAEVRVDDRGTVIKLQTGGDEFSRTDNDPNKALQEFKSHIINSGKAEGGLVVNGIPFSLPGSRDNLLAPLRQGEFVVREEATRQFHPLLDAINRGQVTSRTLGGLARAGMGMPGATVGSNVVVRFFDELDGAWTTLADQADAAFGDVTSTVEQWRETGAAKVAEFAETSKAYLDGLAPKSVEVFAGMGETLRLWAEDGSTRLTEFVTATGERLGELVPLTGETMRVMGETLVTWIDDGLRGWDAYATGVTASHDMMAEHHAMRAEEMGIGWANVTTRMGADQTRLEAATTASYRAVGTYATSTLAAINSAFASMVAAAVARLAELRASAGATIAAINGEVASAEASIARAREAAASIPAPGAGYDKDRGFATGGDAVFTSPTRIMVAEQGPERISARPLGRGRGGSGQTLVFQGPVIANDLSMTQLARRLMREVEREQQRRR